MIAEKVSGKTMLQLYHEEIIDPLNLKHTYFVPYEPAPAALLTGCDRDLSHFPGMLDIKPDNTSWATLAFSSGAMVSTAEDLGTFLDHLTAGDLLSAASMQEMTTFVDSVNPGFPAQNGYGLGLMRLDVDGHELIGHVGQFMGFTTIAMYSPDKGYTVVVICNLSNPELVNVVAEIQKIIR
jgi:D-alanyl-D-alanine carboxypeptidase